MDERGNPCRDEDDSETRRRVGTGWVTRKDKCDGKA